MFFEKALVAMPVARMIVFATLYQHTNGQRPSAEFLRKEAKSGNEQIQAFAQERVHYGSQLVFEAWNNFLTEEYDCFGTLEEAFFANVWHAYYVTLSALCKVGWTNVSTVGVFIKRQVAHLTTALFQQFLDNNKCALEGALPSGVDFFNQTIRSAEHDYLENEYPDINCVEEF